MEHHKNVIIIGAGINGILALREALFQGEKSICVLEQQDGPGGLWKRLPKWQTIQNDPTDFFIDGFYVPHNTPVTAPIVVNFIEKMIQRYSLEKFICYNTKVENWKWKHEVNQWEISITNNETTTKLTCNQLWVAVGCHGEPKLLPTPPQKDERSPLPFEIVHSSNLKDLTWWKDKDVAVIGGNASALDAIENGLKNDVNTIRWYYNKPPFCGGHPDGSMIKVFWTQCFWAVFALLLGKPFQWAKKHSDTTISNLLHRIINTRTIHKKHLKPDEPFDFGKHQYLPGRRTVYKDESNKVLPYRQSKVLWKDNTLCAIRDNQQQLPINTQHIVSCTGYHLPDILKRCIPKFIDVLSPQSYDFLCVPKSIEPRKMLIIGTPFVHHANSATPFMADIILRFVIPRALDDTLWNGKTTIQNTERLNHMDVLFWLIENMGPFSLNRRAVRKTNGIERILFILKLMATFGYWRNLYTISHLWSDRKPRLQNILSHEI